jgi:Ni/Co efflux regulator RcnB
MMKRMVICVLALAIILAVAMAASERARAFVLIGQTPPQSGNFLLVNPGVMALANIGMALKVQ